ncbi:MAG: ABC transporter ATP-binding protein [Gammaproteobacteria bacterium]|nr:ABC transporter ATP-binding protein [Gammaproteobacteria bacterium]
MAFKDLTLAVKKGEFVSILGPSGCGKSTLLRVLAGLEAPSGGDYSYNDQMGESSAFSMVFQEHGLFPWMTLERNISFILENNAEIDRNSVSKISKEYLAIVGLTDYANFYPHQVSGGMKQRVSVARSFANNPAILFMDEPFVFLDFQSRFLLHELLLKIWYGSNKTVLFVTHDIEEAVMLSDRIIVLSGQPGSIIADESVDIPRPRDLITTRKSTEFIAKVDKYIQIIRNDIRY